MYNTAIFIDGDNIHINNIKFTQLFNKIQKDNNILIKRVYGDWKLEQMSYFWNEHILSHSLEEIQISRLSGKNSTDSKIIVDVMHSLHHNSYIDKYILIGSDKDYIPLIRYAIQCNKIFDVYGLSKQTSHSIMNACTNYYDIEEYIQPYENQYDNYYENGHYENEYEENESMIEEEKEDEIYSILDNFIDEKGIYISDLKKKIKSIKKKELFDKEFNNLDVFIKNNFSDYFNVKIKKNSRVKINKIT